MRVETHGSKRHHVAMVNALIRLALLACVPGFLGVLVAGCLAAFDAGGFPLFFAACGVVIVGCLGLATLYDSRHPPQ